MTQALQALGPENDAQKTPRIAGFADQKELIVGIVSEKDLIVQVFPVKPGFACYVATYVKTQPLENVLENSDAKSAEEAAEIIHRGAGFKQFTHAVSTVAAFIKNRNAEVSVYPSA